MPTTATVPMAASPAQIGLFCKPGRVKRSLFFQKGTGSSSLNWSIRCEASSELLVQDADDVGHGNDGASSSTLSSSLSALEQLKTSTAESQ